MEGMHPHLPDPFGMLYGAYRIGYPSMPFEQSYRCYPASFIDKPQLENGDKVIMPPSALDRLASLRIDYPMLFELHNPLTNRISHCGVLEFIAEEGMIYMPYWMMQNMLLQEGDVVRVKSATLPKGTYVKLQPHTKDFLDIFNPKAVLETTLRNFSCLTVGDNIMVAYNNKQYYIDIIEAKPASAISIIETDCEVDFAPPLDYKEPEPEPVPPPAKPDSSTPQGGSEKKNSEGETAVEPKLSAFSGVGRRLDGKSSKFSPVPATTSSHSTTNTKPSGPSSGPSPSGPSRPSGKLVFGSGRSNAPPTLGASSSNNGSSKPTPPAKKEEKEQKEEPKFQAFSGRKYSLKG